MLLEQSVVPEYPEVSLEQSVVPEYPEVLLEQSMVPEYPEVDVIAGTPPPSILGIEFKFCVLLFSPPTMRPLHTRYPQLPGSFTT